MFLFGTNLKMHQTPDQTRVFVRAVHERAEQVPYINDAALWITPPFTSIEAAADAAHDSRITIGAQNMHWADEGAFTGEVSPTMLKACGAQFVMLGHAERRTLFGETDELLNKKVLAAATHNLDIMLCVGEPTHVKQAHAGDAYVEMQLRLDLAGLNASQIAQGGSGDPAGATLSRLTILYEPLWSVGAGGTAADPAYVANAFANIRRVLAALFGDSGAHVPILYGGSVDATNCADYASLPDCAGMGVGRAGLNVDSFIDVLTNALTTREQFQRRDAKVQGRKEDL